MNLRAVVDELSKLGAISDDEARQSLDRLSTLEKNKPTVGQVGRYAGLGAAAGVATGAVGDLVSGNKLFNAPGGRIRGALGRAASGAIASGAIPLIRTHLDRRAEIGTLRKYVSEQDGQ